jgi:hypothetical protein
VKLEALNQRNLTGALGMKHVANRLVPEAQLEISQTRSVWFPTKDDPS